MFKNFYLYFIVLIIAMSIVYVVVTNKYKYSGLDYNDFILEKSQVTYTQGDVVVYKKTLNEKINCDSIKAIVLNSKKSIVGYGYCNINNENIRINIDASDYRQGKYFLMINKDNNNTLSKDSFEIQIIDFNEKTGMKK